MHEHKQCEHEFKYCFQCDAVYCEKCGNEWKKVFELKTWYEGNTGTLTNFETGVITHLDGTY